MYLESLSVYHITISKAQCRQRVVAKLMALHLHGDATVSARQCDRMMWHVFPVPAISWGRFSCELSMTASKWDRAGGQSSRLNNNDLWPVGRVNGPTHGDCFEPYAQKNSPTIVATGSFPSTQRQLTTTTATATATATTTTTTTTTTLPPPLQIHSHKQPP